MDKENNRMTLTVGRKLFIGFSIMIFLALTIGVYSYPQCQDHKATKISDIDTG